MKIFNSLGCALALGVGLYDSVIGNTMGAIHMTLLAILFQMWENNEGKK